MKKNEFTLDIRQSIARLLEKYPKFQEGIVFSSDADGEKASLTLPNPGNPRFPLIVTMYEKDGIFLDMGIRNSILECENAVTADFLDMLALVLQDRVYVTAIYPNQKRYDSHAPSLTTFHYDTSETDCDLTSDIEKRNPWLKKLKKPTPWYLRPFRSSKEIIETSNYSGSAYALIRR